MTCLAEQTSLCKSLPGGGGREEGGGGPEEEKKERRRASETAKSGGGRREGERARLLQEPTEGRGEEREREAEATRKGGGREGGESFREKLQKGAQLGALQEETDQETLFELLLSPTPVGGMGA